MSRTNDFFITGTDTGVGKTIVTASLLAALRARGVDAVAMKPVQTGAKRGRSPDLDFIAKAAGWKIPARSYSDYAPYCFPFAASPHLSAARAGKRIEAAKLVKQIKALQRRHEAVLVEGAGGVWVPLVENFCMIDLMQACRMPAIIVARAGLGTLNHTILTYEALMTNADAVEPGVIVLSNPKNERSSIITDNVEYLSRRFELSTVFSLSRVDAGRFAAAGEQLLKAYGETQRKLDQLD